MRKKIEQEETIIRLIESGRKQSEVARLLHLSRERVRQIYARYITQQGGKVLSQKEKGELLEKNIIKAIVELSNELGIPPTFQEIANRIGVVHSTVAHRIPKLAAKGLVTYVPHKTRTVRVKGDQ